ncbi:MAG: PP2C family protein-serine/threonine phosphatase [Candidatus Eiseniibacteriota bacterium]
MDLSLALPTLTLVAGAVAALLGLTIVRENPRQKLNWVLGSMLLLGSVGAVFGTIDFAISREEPKLLEAEVGLLSSFGSLWELIFPTFLLFAALFPRERQIIRRLPSLQWLLFVPYLAHLALALLGPPDENWQLANLATGMVLIDRLLHVLDLGIALLFAINASLFSLVNLAYMVLAILALRVSLRLAPNRRLRAQIRVMMAGMGGCFTLYALAVPLPELIGLDVQPVLRVALTVGALVTASLSIAYSIVRYRFLDAKILARRSILFGAASGLLLAIYVTVIHRISQVMAGLVQVDTRIMETAFLVVGLLVFHPVAGRLEEWLEGLLIRDRGDYRAVLRQLAYDVSTVLKLDDLAQRVVMMLESSLMVDRAALFMRSGPGQRLAAAASFGLEPAEVECLQVLDQGDWTTHELPYVHDALATTEAQVPRDLSRLLAVPLAHGGELLGVLLLGTKLTGGGYHAEDRALLTTLGYQVGVAIRNAHLHAESIARSVLEEELRFARQVQQSFLPSRLPSEPPIEVSVVNVPSKHVGGDYVDAIRINDEEIMVAIGDVSGKGVPAALLMSMTRAALRTTAARLRSPRTILESMNVLIHESTSPREFVTFFLACVNRRELVVTYSNGGHDRPLLRRRDGRIEELGQGGMLLGAVPDATFEEASVQLEAGDLLVLYTDGLTEARQHGDFESEMFGTERLECCLRDLEPGLTAAEVLDHLVRRCHDWSGGGELADDMTLLVLRVEGPEGGPAGRAVHGEPATAAPVHGQ